MVTKQQNNSNKKSFVYSDKLAHHAFNISLK